MTGKGGGGGSKAVKLEFKKVELSKVAWSMVTINWYVEAVSNSKSMH